MTEINKTELKDFVFEDTTYKTTFTKKFENRKPWLIANPKQVLSFIPGKILNIYIKEGQEVKKGEPMFVLESMKMNNLIRVSHDGKVKKIHVTEEEKIPKSHLLVEFE